jgi:hypothetical protein
MGHEDEITALGRNQDGYLVSHIVAPLTLAVDIALYDYFQDGGMNCNVYANRFNP